jgi:hypothetical protein
VNVVSFLYTVPVVVTFQQRLVVISASRKRVDVEYHVGDRDVWERGPVPTCVFCHDVTAADLS